MLWLLIVVLVCASPSKEGLAGWPAGRRADCRRGKYLKYTEYLQTVLVVYIISFGNPLYEEIPYKGKSLIKASRKAGQQASRPAAAGQQQQASRLAGQQASRPEGLL